MNKISLYKDHVSVYMNVFKVGQKSMWMTSRPRNSTPKELPKGNENMCLQKHLHMKLVLSIIAKKWKRPKCLSLVNGKRNVDEWINIKWNIILP